MKTRNKGLPCKSYVYLIEIDVYINMILSFLSRYNWFDQYISSLITWRYKYVDREKTALSFLRFSCVYDETRVLELKRWVHRSTLIRWFHKLFKTEGLPGVVNQVLADCFPMIHSVQKQLVQHYTVFAVKQLLLRRRGEKNPDMLKGDAYESIVDAIDNYNPSVSKIPFNKFLNYYIKNKKNIVIQRELWGLAEGSLVPLEEGHEPPVPTDTTGLDYLDEILSGLNTEYKRVLYNKYMILDVLTPQEVELTGEYNE